MVCPRQFTAWCNGVGTGLVDGQPARPASPTWVRRCARAENVVAVRVQQWSASSYLEDQDMRRQSASRRWRCSPDPNRGLDDAFVHADYDAASGHGRLWVAGDEVVDSSLQSAVPAGGVVVGVHERVVQAFVRVGRAPPPTRKIPDSHHMSWSSR